MPALAQQVAPFGTPAEPHKFVQSDGNAGIAGVIPNRAALIAMLGGGGTQDDFESFSIPDGAAVNTDVAILDENSVANGQGPGLVNDGARYVTASVLQWNGNGYFGLVSKTILSNSGDGTITISYDTPIQAMGVDLSAFDGFGDTANITVLDGSGATVFTGSVSVPGATPVFFGYEHSAGIGSVSFKSGSWPWSNILNDHLYGNTSGCPNDGCGSLKKAKCKNGTIKVKGSGVAGKEVRVDVDGSEAACAKVNGKGKWKAKIGGQSSGVHNVTACNSTSSVNCP